MRENSQNKQCVAVIGSMTQAMRAQKALAMAAIRSEVIKADSSKTGRGCAYGVSYSCLQEQNVNNVLKNSGIRIRSRYGGER